MKTLANPISIPNIRKWQVLRFTAFLDDSPPWGCMLIQILGTGAVLYTVKELQVYDGPQPSTVILANPTPLGYLDQISLASKAIVGAFTALQAANIGAGNRAAQLAAIETAALSVGIVDSSLTGT